MNKVDRAGLTRRELLARSVAAGGSFLVGASWVAAPTAAWAVEVVAIKPETMATLVQMARDIYPHDRIPDERYVVAVKGYDTAEQAPMVEAGIAAVDAAARGQGYESYLGAMWEEERVAVLKAVEQSEFFQTVRAGLVTSLYNQKEVWPLFGYEGESFSHGGYIARGYNDIDWL